jgi:hypothetical protein
MIEMANDEYTVDEWFEQIQAGLEYRAQYGMEDKWAKVESLFYNAHPANSSSGPNIIYSTGDAFLSTVHTPNPYVMIEPKTIEQVTFAPIVENMSNDLICETQLKREMHSCGLYSYLWGTSVIKIGYDSEFGWNPGFDANGKRQPVGASLTRFGKNQHLNEYSDNKPGMPWVKACLPHDIVVPWGTKDLDSAPWICHRIVRHIDDIMSDPKYTSKQNLEPVMSMRDFTESYMSLGKPYRIGPDILMSTSTESTGETEYVEMWEIHDKRTHKIFVIATNHKKFLRNETNFLQIRGLPFVELGFVPKGRTFWRTSDALYLLNHQAELSDITLQARKQRRLNILKWIVKNGAFKDAELRKLTSRDVGAVAMAENTGGPLQDTVINAPTSNANQQLYMEAEDVRGAARETVGFDRNSAGQYQGARTTAREVQAVQQARDLRMGRRQTCVADAYKEVLSKIHGIVFKFWTTPKVTQVMGPEGAMIWQQFVPAQLEDSYNLDIVFDDPQQDTMQSRQQEAMMIVQQSATDPTIDPIAARQNLARSSPNARIASVFKPGIISPMGQGAGGSPAVGAQPGGARPALPAAGQR